jgi:hypothetical protein
MGIDTIVAKQIMFNRYGYCGGLWCSMTEMFQEPAFGIEFARALRVFLDQRAKLGYGCV